MKKDSFLSFTVVALSFILMSLSQTSRAEVFKCEVDGKVEFQDRPCDTGESQSTVEVKVHNGSGIDDPEMRLISMRQIAVGMSEKGLLRSWGKPTDINRSSYGSAQWVYRRGPGQTQYVYVKNGIITSWSD